MTLLSAEDALLRIVKSIKVSVDNETLPLISCDGRVLATSVMSKHTQPPFDASAMDGYALCAEDTKDAPVTLKIIGESAAGHIFEDSVESGETVRIFTGAPVPKGCNCVIMQEDVTLENESIRISAPVSLGKHIRKKGQDFTKEQEYLLVAGQRLDARHIALAAAMGHNQLDVKKRPKVAILATGDELVEPGSTLASGQIVSSNPYAVAAIVKNAGGEPILLGIVQDTLEALDKALEQAEQSGADIVVTTGGVSVGEHDLVYDALIKRGFQLDFWKVAIKPGKPLLHGSLNSKVFLGLPGNPVAVVLCSMVFLVPAIHALLGKKEDVFSIFESGILGTDMPVNENRRDYLRAKIIQDPQGALTAYPFPVQDSSQLRALADADGLVVREPNVPAARIGDSCTIIRFTHFFR